ncbi:SIR2 family protein [Arthrobacter sp. I2-34]|uniref:SIR2 family protein n=1 Tax=Arthrobacter hankyongi TaxID=2904801 RepID=A0ABS9L869_9MICC|nr:SIR2 family protein [Arthrobacter hankyongi]MCG2622687.1 SIR2 family protein [Arthrobacter hankyongi]
MGHGWKRVTIKSTEGDELSVPALRRRPEDFPDSRIRLLHLHGSLTYWSDRERTVFAKLDTAFLQTYDQWQAVRDQETNVRPVVVLANQRDKAAHVTEFPFSLAYEMFGRGLKDAQHWLVVGYSFRDECVNEMLRAEFSERVVKPKVLVVTYGDQPSRHDVERALGWAAEDSSSKHWLTINRYGADEMTNSLDWKSFIS